jgi:hypothetical protein
VSGVKDIPDLFLAAVKDYPVEPKHHQLLVEIKAPSVSLGTKEREQIRRYAQRIKDSKELDKRSTRWDLFLVSAKVSEEIQEDRHQKSTPHGCLWEWDNMTVWAFEWNEIIAQAREELQLVREHLKTKSSELSVSDYLREEYPQIFGAKEKPPAERV